ncbi:hypothetical protein AWW66_12380 [Micromonospora rosaria]|uniref:Uncharacterized protein n=1 Tax=Micromonospora rosaria TaxID=47874 RepID=A0A136PTL0_9ACTN|nr:hypothetical protein AWW66_12380 [Micromonospora rosaria]
MHWEVALPVPGDLPSGDLCGAFVEVAGLTDPGCRSQAGTATTGGTAGRQRGQLPSRVEPGWA